MSIGVVSGKVVAHDPNLEVAPGVDDAADGRFVRPAHDDDERCARFRHHLGFEIAAVHRLEIRHDRLLREPGVKLFDRMQPLRQQQRRAGLEPVHTSFDRHRCRVDGFLDTGEIERELHHRMRQRLKI